MPGKFIQLAVTWDITIPGSHMMGSLLCSAMSLSFGVQYLKTGCSDVSLAFEEYRYISNWDNYVLFSFQRNLNCRNFGLKADCRLTYYSFKFESVNKDLSQNRPRCPQCSLSRKL